jgi:protein involved in polysaccharide export with SLBB domain
MAVFTGLFFLCGAAWAQSMMTDEQVLEYTQQGLSQGKSRDELIAELSLRGVNRAQAERVFTLYQSRQANDPTMPAMTTESRNHTINPLTEQETEAPAAIEAETSGVYGRNIFNNQNLSFAPSENLATPRNYRLGPGDEVIIDIFGRNQTSFRGTISPEGSINVDILGPLYLSGMTVEEANAYLKRRLSSIYGGMSGSGTDMRLSLGQIRTIQVNVLGDVASPGTYQLSAFSTAFHALYRAGGIVEPGTVRNIKVVRGNKVAGDVDVYDFLTRGNTASDIRLEEGDVILVAPYDCLVSIEGSVKRPMRFEMKEGETLANLVEYAGGFATGANRSFVTVIRQDNKNFEVRTVEEADYASFRLRSGDRVEVGELQSLFQNRTAIHGAVYFPGTFELGEVRTAKGLVERAGGLLPEAFADRVVVNREHPDKTKEVFSLNLKEILAGNQPDFVLQNNDELYVASGFELKDQGTMTISGMVNQPGTFPFAENTTVEDIIILAGGLQDGASTSRVDVTRRKKDTEGMVATSDIGELYVFSIKDGLVADGDRSFVLEPYDEVVVHRSPSYNIQRHFTINGEVNFPGTYALTSREEHITDLIKKAGGLTDFAYSKGARLTRRATEEELTQANEMVEIVEQRLDTVDVTARRATQATYTVAIDLDKALANPGGEEDVVLREEDILEIPVKNNVIRIYGAVNYPTAVNYDPSMRGKGYINAAGGYAEKARRSKAYVVNMGGRAKKLHSWTKVDPGAEIYVPFKEESKKEFNPSTLTAIASAAASLGTLGMSVFYIINMTKK